MSTSILCRNEKISKDNVQNNGWLNLNSTFQNYSKVYVFPLIMWKGQPTEKTEDVFLKY